MPFKTAEFRLSEPVSGEDPRLSTRNDNELDKEKLEQLFNTYNKVNVGIEIPGVRFTDSAQKLENVDGHAQVVLLEDQSLDNGVNVRDEDGNFSSKLNIYVIKNQSGPDAQKTQPYYAGNISQDPDALGPNSITIN